MPTNFIKKTFERWLSQNRARFKYQPVLVKAQKRYLKLRFVGITQKISVIVTNYDIDITVNHKGIWWDIIISLDVSERKSPDGFYCERCDPDKRELFPSREALFADHCLDPLLEWVNRNFDESRCLFLFDYDGMTSARIEDKDYDKDKEFLVYSSSVVTKRHVNVKTLPPLPLLK